jgi:hypothetical protein
MPSDASSTADRRGARQSLQQPSLQADVLTHHDTGRAILSFLDASSLFTLAAVCRPLHVLANIGALWRILLLAERPHLAPLLVGSGDSAKALFRKRMGKDDKGEAPGPSEASERERLQERLQNLFIHVEVHYNKKKKELADGELVGSAIIPFSHAAKMKSLLTGGVQIPLPPPDGTVWVEAVGECHLHLMDLSGHALHPPLTAKIMCGEWERVDNEYHKGTLVYDPAWCPGGPEPFFYWEHFVAMEIRAPAKLRDDEDLVRLNVCIELWTPQDGPDQIEETDVWRMLEAALDEQILIR